MQLPVSKRRIDPSWWMLLGILALNALLKWRFFSGLTQADDFSYGVYSFSLFRLPLPWDMTLDFRALRLALLLPVGLLFRALPPGEFVAVLYPMLASFGMIALVFLIGRKLYGNAAGLLSAFALAAFPGDVIYGTMLLPDVLAPFFLVCAVWAFLNAEENPGSRSEWWYLAAGIAMFLAFNTRENSYWFLLFFLPFAFNAGRWKRGFWMTGAGFAIPALLLYGFYALKTEDFLYNLHLAEKYRDPLIKSGYIPPNSRNWLTSFYYMFPWFRVLPDGQRQFASPLFGLTFYLGAPFLVYSAVQGWIQRDRRLLLAPWWFLLGYAFIEFGTISFSSYQMMVKLPRFLLTVTPPLALAYGFVLAEAFGLGKKKPVEETSVKVKSKAAVPPRRPLYIWFTAPAAVLALALALFTSYGAMRYQDESLEYNMRSFRWANELLKDRPHKPIYDTGGWWKNKLSFYMLPDIRFADLIWRRSEMLRDLKAAQNPVELRDSYIVLDRTNFSGQNDLRIRHDYSEFGPWAILPPKEWKLIGVKYGTEIYEVPSGWTWIEPEGKEMAYNSMLHALKVDDFVLFLYNLHPDFVKKLNKEQFWGLFALLKDEKNPDRNEILGKRLEYREYEGKWKIFFNIFQ
ncbi:MAG: ArnT family glycosyltransferase [Candidatus Latescibacterota bacterium]